MDKVAVIGLGRLGFPLAVALAHRGFSVIGIDIDSGVVDAVNARRVPSHICEPGLPEMLDDAEALIAMTEIEAAARAPVSIVIVGTPSEYDESLSLQYILDVCRKLGAALRGRDAYHTVIISSTIMPGSCDGPITETLEVASGRKVGKGLGLCYCPEFVALGNVIKGFLEPDFVVVGASDIRAGFLATGLYKTFCLNAPPIVQVTLVNAEIAKLAVNSYVATKIAFANRMAELCEGFPGADVDIVTHVMGMDPRIGSKYLTGAAAYGGRCFPRDVRALRSLGCDFMDAVDAENYWQNRRLALMVSELLDVNTRVGILGLAFKPGTNVSTESAGMLLLETLGESVVTVFDPLIEAEQSVESAQVCVDRSDVVIVTIPCDEFRNLRFYKGQAVIDCWRMYSAKSMEESGANYIAVGVGPCKGS